MQLLNGEIYVFFVVFFISFLIITVYDIIEPEEALVKNFVPFPDIKPTNLPGPDFLPASYYPPVQK